MASFLGDIGNWMGPTIGVGGQGQSASNNAWQYGQFQPYNVNNPMGQISFNGTNVSGGLSPLQGAIQGAFGNQVLGNLNGPGSQYHPNTNFLAGQYSNIYGPGFQNNVNQQFSNLMNAQRPQIDQYLNSNLTNEFAKGTLASTAGGYQTYGADQAVNSLMNQNMNQAFAQTSQQAAQRMQAAQGVAGLGETQAEFAPQLGLQQNNAAMQGMFGQNSLLAQLMGQAGNLGAQRSGANVAAAMPGVQTGYMNDLRSAGFLNGLLFGGGTQGGLMQALLGNGSNGITGGVGALGSAIGKGIQGIGSIFSGGGGGTSSAGDGSNLGYQYTNTDPGAQFNTQQDPLTSTNQGDGNTTYWDTGTGFNPAGGEAANPGTNTGQGNGITMPSAGQIGSGANDVLGLYNGLSSGSPLGDAAAAADASKLYGLVTGNSTAANFGGYLGGGLGIISGLKQGGVAGDAQAALGAANLASKAGLLGSGAGSILGPAGAVLSVYNAANNWQSGKAGQDALSDASAGASIGAMFGPIGAGIGALGGAVVGGLSSLFGPGAKDPETQDVQGLINAVGANPGQAGAITSQVQNPYLELAGLMDERSSTLPMYQQYGRMGEQKFTNDLLGKVQAAEQQGMHDPNQIYNQVVAPWVAGMGSGWKNVGSTYTATTQGLLQDMVNQAVSGQYAQDWKAVGGDSPFANLSPAPTGGNNSDLLAHSNHSLLRL